MMSQEVVSFDSMSLLHRDLHVNSYDSWEGLYVNLTTN